MNCRRVVWVLLLSLACGLPAPADIEELELEHALALRQATPHTAWARPYAQGKLRVLFVTHDEDGRPRDAIVVRSEPEGRFDRAALEALTTYRYDPFVLNGHTYARRVWLRMRFNLQPIR